MICNDCRFNHAGYCSMFDYDIKDGSPKQNEDDCPKYREI